MTSLTSTQSIGGAVIALLLLFLCITLFRRPMKLLLKLFFNTIGGFIFLFVLNFFGSFIGITLGINWFNAIVVGIFGLPGVGLLLILQWMLLI